MDLSNYFNKNNKLSTQQQRFVSEVFYPDYRVQGLDLLEPLGIGGFTIETKYSKYFIKIDGSVKDTSPKDFKLIEISSAELDKDIKEVVYKLRRNFIADRELFNLYLNRVGTVRPHGAQQDALNSLNNSRALGKNKGLAVLATGLGKTYLSAFDAKEFKAKTVLFIVHINEILKQTLDSFKEVFFERTDELGYFTGRKKEKDKKILFASVQTLSREKNIKEFAPKYFDYIIIDETHHTAAPTYGKIFKYFDPKFFLGLTATPDRMDQKDILSFYDNNIVFYMGQEQAIHQGYLVPFRYYGFKDNVDYSNIYFNGFRYDIEDLNKHLLIDARDEAIISKFKQMAGDRKSIGFCASIEHADRCTREFNKNGIKAVAIHSKISENVFDFEKEPAMTGFRKGTYQVAFVVDMFNEGVDVPDVSCLLFLRPTESKTIFIQHLGRGLRVSPEKEDVIILDFIGNYKTATLILPSLGLSGGVRNLKKKIIDGKELFVYDNAGCQVILEPEVIDIFKKVESESTKIVKKDILTPEWIEYGNYLEKWTKNNLYWKRGQQNQYFEVQMEALNILAGNPKISENDFVSSVQKIVEVKYPKKNMTAGFRSLMLSKISGFLTSKLPLTPTEPFFLVKNACKDFAKIENYIDIVTDQVEKIFYWNSIYGTYSKYVPAEKRVSFKDFRIYPFFFVYDCLLRLNKKYGYEPSVSEFEFNSFLAITKTHTEIEDVVQRLIGFREYGERYELEKYLNSKNKIDPRFYKIMHYSKYLSQDSAGISLKDGLVEELGKRVKIFNELYDSGKLIIFDENNAKIYQNMLYSKGDILSYHMKI